MRILGIDPGLLRTGWGVLDVAAGGRLDCVAQGVICPPASAAAAERLRVLFEGLQAVMHAHAPKQAAVEQVFVNGNAASSLKLGQARAVALLVPALHGLIVAEYAANAIKKTVVGAGHADKTQVQYMLKILVRGELSQQADAADALAVAVCHAHHASNRLLAAVTLS